MGARSRFAMLASRSVYCQCSIQVQSPAAAASSGRVVRFRMVLKQRKGKRALNISRTILNTYQQRSDEVLDGHKPACELGKWYVPSAFLELFIVERNDLAAWVLNPDRIVGIAWRSHEETAEAGSEAPWQRSRNGDLFYPTNL